MAGYVALLNARAKELGATATYIGDPTGVGDNSYTTAADLSRIALAAMKNDIYLSFVGLRNGETNDGKPFLNRNRLITDSQSGGVQYAGMCVGGDVGCSGEESERQLSSGSARSEGRGRRGERDGGVPSCAVACAVGVCELHKPGGALAQNQGLHGSRNGFRHGGRGGRAPGGVALRVSSRGQ